MKNPSFLLFLFLFLVAAIINAQINYPYMDTEGNRDIQAYWYNIPEASVELDLSGNMLYFHSLLYIYGKAPGDSFNIKAKAFLADGEEIFDHIFSIKKEQAEGSYNIEFNQGFFRLRYPVEYLEQNPDSIIVTIQSDKEERSRKIKCQYHKLSGKVTDFDAKPIPGYIAICPDEFVADAPDKGIGIVCDSSGNYEIELPERTYNAVIANYKTWGTKTLEVWGWHIIMDSDQYLDFKIGTGEVYNLNVWANNGGGNSYFISFRPMTFFKSNKYPINLNGKEFTLLDCYPPLERENITVMVNGKKAEIISLQKYQETGSPGNAITAYLVQVNRKGLDRTGKQTVILEYQKEMEVEGKKVICNSMGYLQFFLNYSGLSKYF
jgi:hypothetical protein